MKSILLFIVLIFPSLSHAIDVGDVTIFLQPTQSKISNEIRNKADDARLVTVAIEKISSPYEDGVTLPGSANSELMLTPARMLLPAKAGDIVSFFYNGPNDNTERYYRVYWTEQSIATANTSASPKVARASTSARISTILVVTPRKANFSYSFSQYELSNTGNISFSVTAYGRCKKELLKGKEECREKMNLTPGKKANFRRLDVRDESTKIGIWNGDDFIIVK